MLGMDWLGTHSPMQCDWKEKEISFDYKGKQVALKGITGSPHSKPQQLSVQMLQAWETSNDIWAMAILEQQ